jgi:NADPH-dependent 2,4-dienoyl-CoA reductase/sulfur reductase-like enzyme
MARSDYDLVIIGAGAAGLIAARFAAQLGARVLLAERDRIGGDGALDVERRRPPRGPTDGICTAFLIPQHRI